MASRRRLSRSTSGELLPRRVRLARSSVPASAPSSLPNRRAASRRATGPMRGATVAVTGSIPPPIDRGMMRQAMLLRRHMGVVIRSVAAEVKIAAGRVAAAAATAATVASGRRQPGSAAANARTGAMYRMVADGKEELSQSVLSVLRSGAPPAALIETETACAAIRVAKVRAAM